MSFKFNREILFMLAPAIYVGFVWIASFPTVSVDLSVKSENATPSIFLTEEALSTDQPNAAAFLKPALSKPAVPPMAIQRRSFFKQSIASSPVNIILLIGDGMGLEYLKAASYFAHGEAGRLTMEGAPFRTEIDTSALGGRVTDSAAAATAMATGHKTSNGVLSLNEDWIPLETSLEYYQKRCKSTGLVATSTMTHATPAAFAAHSVYRTAYTKIAEDYFEKTRPNLLFGGGGPSISADYAAQNGYTVVTNRAEMESLNAAETHVSGQFSNAEMAYEYDDLFQRTAFYLEQPHLSEMSSKALDLLSTDSDGFFLMVEGSRIDHAGHSNAIEQVIYEVLEFDKTVQVVLEWAATRNDTLVLVTADHETGGLVVTQNNGAGNLPNVTWTTYAHTGAPVPLLGWGPNAEMVMAATHTTDVYQISIAGAAPAPDNCTPRATADESSSDGSTENSQLQKANKIYIPLIE